jgi:hypothetical protein
LRQWKKTRSEQRWLRETVNFYILVRDLLMRAPTHKPRLMFWELTKGCKLRCMNDRTTTELRFHDCSLPFSLPSGELSDPDPMRKARGSADAAQL